MAEEEVHYASVVFRTKEKSEAKNEQTVSDEVEAENKPIVQTLDIKGEQAVCDEVKVDSEAASVTNGFLTNKKADSRGQHCQQLACCFGIICAILLSGIIVFCVYQLNSLNDENLNLTMQNKELEMEKRNLTEQIYSMETTLNELNVSLAQWIIDAYCLKNNARKCQPCQEGWLYNQSSCYAINDYMPAGQKTWEYAGEDCRGKISDLVVVNNDAEKKYVSEHSWGSSGTKGYWIGLRAVDGKWKWVNGSDLTDNSFNQQPQSGHCVISVINNGWKSVSCAEKNRWICEKKALSL